MELSRAISLPVPTVPVPHSIPGTSPLQDPDEDVLALTRRGNLHAALTILMRRHSETIYRYCREELGDQTLAEDVHQQIFIQAYRDLPRFGYRSLLKVWLLGITRHRVLDAVKSRRRAEAHIGEDEDADMIDPTPPPDERLHEAQQIRIMIRCLYRLGKQIQGTLVLRYQQGLSFEELARLLGQRAGTLEARVRRALPQLRSAIEREIGDVP